MGDVRGERLKHVGAHSSACQLPESRDILVGQQIGEVVTRSSGEDGNTFIAGCTGEV